MNNYSLRKAALVSAAAVVASVLGAAGCSNSSSSTSSPSASPTSSPGSASASAAGASASGLSLKQIVLATTLKHSFQPNGKGAAKTEPLSQPDDIVPLGGNLYVGFQNGVGSQGEASTSGNLDSTLGEFTPSGSLVKQWDVKGKIDGMGTDPAAGQVIVTVNEDSNSSLYTVSGGALTHYTYPALPHLGGTDAVAVDNGKILISASAPGTAGKAPASAPAVYTVTLNSAAKTASVAPLFADNATATVVNTGKKTTLALTDPDSSAVVPAASPQFAGDYALDAQGDLQLIFSPAAGQNLSVLKLAQSVDDIAWATSATGTLYTTDASAGSVDALTGTFQPGTLYTAVTPCNANSAPTTCPAPGYTANYLGTVNLKTGKISTVAVNGPVTPKGLIFVP